MVAAISSALSFLKAEDLHMTRRLRDLVRYLPSTNSIRTLKMNITDISSM
jgi:hypothetical protein